MNAVINIGNTHCTVAIERSGRLIRRACFGTYAAGLAKKLAALAKAGDIERIAVCSVVPKAARAVQSACMAAWKEKPLFAGRDLAVPMKNRYRTPAALGQDRLVSAFAAASLYGKPCIVLDFGTAITIDVVSAKKEYLGGMILPGLQMSANALANGTARLPKLRISLPGEFIARDTASGILSGVVYGTAAVADSFVRRLKSETLGSRARVIATGGNAALVKKVSSSISIVDPDLTLKGLVLLLKGRS